MTAPENVNDNNKIIVPYTCIANHILKMLFTREYLSECEIHIFFVIVSKTISYQGRKYYNFSYNYLEKMTKYTKKAIIQSIKDMQARNIIENVKTPGAKINCYQINTKTSEWIKRDSIPGYTQENKHDAFIGSIPGYTQENKHDAFIGSIPGYTSDSIPGYTSDSIPGYTSDSIPGYTQENKNIINKNIDINIYINKSKKIINAALLEKDFFDKNPRATKDNFSDFKRELILNGYLLKYID